MAATKVNAHSRLCLHRGVQHCPAVPPLARYKAITRAASQCLSATSTIRPLGRPSSPPPRGKSNPRSPPEPAALPLHPGPHVQDVKDCFREAVGDVLNVRMVGKGGMAVVEFANYDDADFAVGGGLEGLG